MGEMSKKFVNILFLFKYYILGEAMKRALFIILVTFLLVLILIYLYDEREVVLNKKYYNDNVYIEYPFFNNDAIDGYISSYLNKYKDSDSYLFVDYDYVDDDGNIDLIMFVYEEHDGIVREVEDYFQIDLINGEIVLVKDLSHFNDYDYELHDNDDSKKYIAITFDDGPNYQTNRVLDILEKYDVKATFFILGCNIRGNEMIIKRMNDMGMEIGNHMYSHKLISKMSSDDIVREYKMVDSLIFDVILKRPTLIRPSYGVYNSKVREVVDRPIILWNIDTLDWKYHNSRKIFERVIRSVRDGDIILMHDIYRASANSLEYIIPKLKSEGYEFVTVSSLFSYNHINLEKGKVYSRGY